MLQKIGSTGATNTLPSLTTTEHGAFDMAKALTTSEIRNCEACETTFFPRFTTSRFCSRSCSSSSSNRLRKDHSEATLMERFWAKVDKTPGFGPNGDCWRWTARIDGRGYGEIKVAGRYKKAHRLSLFGMGDLDNPLFACHRCDNPECVRPEHLFPGAAIVNVRDMVAKGRHGGGRRSRKLTDDQVREIRRTGISHNKGAAKYGVSGFTIAGVRKGTIYKDVN